MKSIGLFIITVILVFGIGGYFFFHGSNTPMIVTNTLPLALETPGMPGDQTEQGQSTDDSQPVHILPEAGSVAGRQPTVTSGLADNQQGVGGLKIENRLVDFGFAVPVKPRSIDTIVLHSSYDLNGADPYSISGVIKEYEDYGVSAHYLIDRKGGVYRLVEDKNIAYHAGVSKMPDGRRDVNNFSIGIEMMNTEQGQFTNAQYTAVNALIMSLKNLYPIKSVVGHQDIAPGRKTDPWNFDWKKLKE